MSITVIRRPIVSSGGNNFRFNSVALPTIYELERRDFTWSQINNSGGFTQVQFTGVNLTSSFAIGDSIYLQSLSNSLYNGYTIVSAVNFTAGNTLITTQLAHAGSAASGFVNNDTERPGYYVEVRFFAVGGALLTSSILEVAPSSVGRMIVDVSEFCKSFLSPDFQDIAPAFTVTEDPQSTKEIYIGYREVWIGSANSETADSSNPFYAVLGAQQLPLSNGSNYGVSASRYTTIVGGTPVSAKILRTSSLCKVWIGWPFTLSALFDGNTGDGLSVEVIGNLSTVISSAGYDGNGMVRANLGSVNWSAVTNLYSATAKIHHPDGETAVISLQLSDACERPVLLCFRNSLGGDCWHMFDYTQEYSYLEDNGTKVKRMLLTAYNLTSEQWDELNDMITYGSELKENITEVLTTTNRTKSRAYQQVYKVDQDGTMTGVIVIPTLNTTQTRRVKHTFEVEIEFPEKFLP